MGNIELYLKRLKDIAEKTSYPIWVLYESSERGYHTIESMEDWVGKGNSLRSIPRGYCKVRGDSTVSNIDEYMSALEEMSRKSHYRYTKWEIYKVMEEGYHTLISVGEWLDKGNKLEEIPADY